MKHALDHYILHQASIHESFAMTGQELKVYVQLLSHVNDKTLETFVGTPSMARYTGLDRRSVQRVFHSLQEIGAIKRYGKVNGTNKYRLVFPDSIPFNDDATYDAPHDATHDAKGDAQHDAKGDARVRHSKSSSPQVNTQKAESEKEKEKEHEKELDPETVFLGSYGHVIDLALKLFLHNETPEHACLPRVQDSARHALTEKCRARHKENPHKLPGKGTMRSEKLAHDIAIELTNEQHPPASTPTTHDIHKLAAQAMKQMPDE